VSCFAKAAQQRRTPKRNARNIGWQRRPRFGVRQCSAAFFLTMIVAMVLATALTVSAQEIPQIAPRAIPVAPTTAGPNDIARFLAGMPVPKNSPLAPLTRDPAWQAHSAFFEGEFTKLDQRQLQKLHAWTATNLPEVMQPTPVAFYMFSGPDFLYVDQFFPNASVYVLCGKESMGPPPDPLRITNLSGALGNLENAMKSSLNTTYFITKNMKVDLQQQTLNGVLPILYVFIARGDKSITNVAFGSLNSNGAFEEFAPGKKGGSTPGEGTQTRPVQQQSAVLQGAGLARTRQAYGCGRGIKSSRHEISSRSRSPAAVGPDSLFAGKVRRCASRT